MFWKQKESSLEPEILAVGNVAYEKHTFFKKNGESHFWVRNVAGENGITELSLMLFKAVKANFSSFTYAEVKKINKETAISDPNSEDGIKYKLDQEDDHDYLILTDSNRNKLFLTGCTVGYGGTGPHGTREVLNTIGFKVPMRFVIAMKEFELSHPDYDPDYQRTLSKIDKPYHII